MATNGDLIAQYITDEMSVVTTNFNNNTESPKNYTQYISDIKSAICTGIYSYFSTEYEFDVTTNGILNYTSPVGTTAITDYNVVGTYVPAPSNVLLPLIISGYNTNASSNIQLLFEDILTWLGTFVITITGVGDNVPQLLSTITGVASSFTFPNYVASNLAAECYNEITALDFTNATSETYKEVWKKIGKYIYEGIDGNIVTFPTVVGTSLTPVGVYTASLTTGTIKFS